MLERADGSAYLEFGDNKVLAAVYGPREFHIRRFLKPNMAVLRCRYNMAPFSVLVRAQSTSGLISSDNSDEVGI